MKNLALSQATIFTFVWLRPQTELVKEIHVVGDVKIVDILSAQLLQGWRRK